MITHGGTYYDVPIGGYILQLRFERIFAAGNLHGKTNLNEATLNHPPVLRDSLTGVVVEGKYRPQ
jgi:hypothetical protein